MRSRPIERGRWGIAEDLVGKTVTWGNGGTHVAIVAEVFYKQQGAAGYMIRTTDNQVVSSGVCRVIEQPIHNAFLADCECESCKRQSHRRVRMIQATPRKGSY